MTAGERASMATPLRGVKKRGLRNHLIHDGGGAMWSGEDRDRAPAVTITWPGATSVSHVHGRDDGPAYTRPRPGGSCRRRRFVAAEMARQKFPEGRGIVRNGVPSSAGYGIANASTTHRDAGDDLQSGSVGKQFTAAAVMLIAEEGRVGLSNSSHLRSDATTAWKA